MDGGREGEREGEDTGQMERGRALQWEKPEVHLVMNADASGVDEARMKGGVGPLC